MKLGHNGLRHISAKFDNQLNSPKQLVLELLKIDQISDVHSRTVFIGSS